MQHFVTFFCVIKCLQRGISGYGQRKVKGDYFEWKWVSEWLPELQKKYIRREALLLEYIKHILFDNWKEVWYKKSTKHSPELN